ncbi:amino acid ABC transporter substrate-binding protein [Paenibacillus sp. UMB7766-LJ446]|uniref:Amino acid ABC transporter substrate-binding protein n=1 Tax=Paenibacillus vandeheii TaxID=3035917 RepID=A0ABT8J562_9BACL|nr:MULTISPECIES: amino acid ABC transporter substrate-binding protein [Paenibacillus]OME80396.1 amino acid ABC transporter substrate-binding protein [Paenibacillus pabuli]OPG95490.1 amino acid ABC transporter substrate-binding protein [Chryseobacterium mucoviscidosis]KGP84557.1 amino acid ABC transporter substrate-binding protein [Paenibacillus sp. MAEPY2]KGP86724.1 amino acid ABC transporter substrate-binding protein [Paenibacillus sp. MAEPY1]MDK8191344.1 amino acid ABC transporter substrate-
MRKQAIFLLLISICMIVVAGCSSSGSKDDNAIIVGIDDKFAPMGFRDDKNEIVGFDIDYARAAAEKMGKEITFQPIDWSSKESELNSGRIDLIWNGYTITDERKDKVLFTKPYLENSQVAVTLADSPITKLDELDGKNVGLQALSSAADALAASPLKDKVNASEFPDNVLALTDLKTKRLDAVIIDEVVARYYMSKEEGTFKLLDESLAPEQYGIGVKKGNEELLNQLQKALDELNADGTAAEISTKWFGEDEVLK